MFKSVVLLSLAAMAVASASALVPLAHSTVVPGVTTVSAYDTRVVHPSPVYTTAVWPAAPLVYSTGLWNSGLHHLHKRSIGLAPAVSYSSIVGPSYYNPWVAGHGYYGARYGAPLLGLGYATAYPRALSVHPY